MSQPRGRDTVLVRIDALRRHARSVEGIVRDVAKGEARQVIDTLGEAEAWLRGQPSPEVVTHVARMVADAGRRLYALGQDVP
jgi:phage-related baseplate assembly protein